MNGRLVTRNDLSPADRAAMFALLSRHFDGVTPDQFAADLNDKTHVILLSHDDARLAGFSTLRFYRDRHRGQPISVVYSGDTIVDPDAWHSSALSKFWIRSVRELHEQHGEGRLFWLLIVSGFRTYRFLPVYWREFFPRFDMPTPDDVADLMRRLAIERFGEHYSPRDGVVRFARPQQLRGDLRGIPDARRTDPHVTFFAAANPGHESGDELVCLTELGDANLTPAGRRMVAAGAPRPIVESVER